MALPFNFGTLSPAARARVVTHDRLCSSLGLRGWDRLWRVDLPLLARALAFAAALGFVLSLGDLTAISLFGSQELVTLPSLIHGQMGSYRANAAAATALVLMTGAIAIVAAAERIGQRA
jgi:thiamine transport system permease protein